MKIIHVNMARETEQTNEDDYIKQLVTDVENSKSVSPKKIISRPARKKESDNPNNTNESKTNGAILEFMNSSIKRYTSLLDQSKIMKKDIKSKLSILNANIEAMKSELLEKIDSNASNKN